MSLWSVTGIAGAAGCTEIPIAFLTPFTDTTEPGVDCLATNVIPSVIFSTETKKKKKENLD